MAQITCYDMPGMEIMEIDLFDDKIIVNEFDFGVSEFMYSHKKSGFRYRVYESLDGQSLQIPRTNQPNAFLQLELRAESVTYTSYLECQLMSGMTL